MFFFPTTISLRNIIVASLPSGSPEWIQLSMRTITLPFSLMASGVVSPSLSTMTRARSLPIGLVPKDDMFTIGEASASLLNQAMVSANFGVFTNSDFSQSVMKSFTFAFFADCASSCNAAAINRTAQATTFIYLFFIKKRDVKKRPKFNDFPKATQSKLWIIAQIRITSVNVRFYIPYTVEIKTAI